MTTTTTELPMHDRVRTFVGAPRKVLIGGRWVEAASGKTFPTYNPATGDVLARVAEGTRPDVVERAVSAARNAFEKGPWRKLTASERGRIIWKLADLLETLLEEFAQLESLDNGKPVGVAEDAKTIQVGPGMDLSTQMGPLVSDEQQRRVLSYLESGFFEGAKAVVDGREFGDKGYFVEPTVLVDTTKDMKVM
jgi:acyl-CoA reductase-like NAD-dependent aldehyde dehydrogenase